MKTSRIVTLFLALLLALCLSAPAAAADAAPVSVSNAQELLAAIAPGAVIELQPGTYNLTQAIAESPKQDRASSWLRFMDCWEGREAVVHDVDGLTLRGVGEVEIVVEPRSADVLRFEYCSNITLENMTLGHTIEPGVCTGDVLEFDNCRGVVLTALDLYGCGTYGVVGLNSSDLRMQSSTIRECSYGLMDLNNCSGFRFNECELRDCGGYNTLSLFMSSLSFDSCAFSGNSALWGFLSDAESNSVRFYSCSFGPWETAQVRRMAGAGGDLSFDQFCTYAEDAGEAGTVTVSSAAEFFDAIRPGAVICLQPGRYDLGAWVEETWAAEGASWNSHHPYVQLQETYDGVEAVISGADYLSIIGLGKDRSDTELYVEPRYEDVLHVVNSTGLALANLTLGHSEGGPCTGSVVNLDSVGDVTLTNLDIFGCGNYGVYRYNCGSIAMRGCTVRECSGGPVSSNYCWGDSCFEDCVFVDSAAGFELWESPSAYFLRCVFGETEYASIVTRDEFVMDSCWH